MRKKYFFLCFLAITTYPLLNNATGQEKTSFDVSVTESLVRLPQANFHSADFNLGTLPSDENGTITLVVKNPTAEPFSFNEITRSCNCVSITPSQNVIPAGGSTEFRLKLKTPKFAARETIFGVVSLTNATGEKRKQTPSISLRITYKLAGFIYIEPVMVSLEIPPSRSFAKMRIPFLITKPITKDRLEVRVDDALKSLKFEFEGTGNEIAATAFVPVQFIEDGPVNGQLTIVDQVTKREDTVFITFRQGKKYKISPSFLQFKRAESESSSGTEGELFEAKVLIRLPESSENAEKDHNRDSLSAHPTIEKTGIQISATVAGVLCRLKTQRLSSRIIKARVSFDPTQLPAEEQLKSGNQLVVWKIQDGEETSSTSSRFVLVK